MMEKVVVLVLSFDKYSDLWPVYFECAKRFWHAQAPTYLVTNEKRPNYEKVGIITTGPEVSWSRRARCAVERVDAKYIVLMLEDYYITSDFADDTLKSFLSFMDKADADYLRIYPFPDLHFKDSGEEGIHLIPNKALYGVNLQPSIWRKEYLIKLLGNEDFSAWQFESRQKNGAATQVKGKLYTVDFAPFKMVNGVLQGKWYTPSVRVLESQGIHVDTSARSVLPWSKVTVYKTKIILRKIAGPNIIRKVKPVLKRLGIKFVTD